MIKQDLPDIISLAYSVHLKDFNSRSIGIISFSTLTTRDLEIQAI